GTPVWITAVVVDGAADQHAYAEGDQTACDSRSRADGSFSRCRCRRWGGWRGRHVDDLRVVLRHIDHLRIRGLHLDDRLIVVGLRRYLLLRRGLQISYMLRLGAQALHGIEHALLIGRERRPELARPVDLLTHHVDDLRELDERACGGAEAGPLRRPRPRLGPRALVLRAPAAGGEHRLG